MKYIKRIFMFWKHIFKSDIVNSWSRLKDCHGNFIEYGQSVIKIFDTFDLRLILKYNTHNFLTKRIWW